MKSKLILNPFVKIAGLRSLAIGIVFMLASGIIGYYSKTHFDGVLNIHSGYGGSFLMHLIEPFLNWIYLSSWFYLLALFLSSSKVRAIDVFGTQAFALIPLFPTSFSGFFKVIDSLSKKLQGVNPGNITPDMLPVNEIIQVSIIGLFLMLFVVWSAIWMFNGYKISSNMPNVKVVPIYIIGILSGMFVPRLLLKLFI